MSLRNRAQDATPFDMRRPPRAMSPLLAPLVWAASWLATRRFHLHLDRRALAGVKGPFVVLATHQGFADYYLAPLAVFPRRACYVSDMEGFAAYGEGLYRALGCIGKRRYAADVSVLLNVRAALRAGRPVVLFPEARHSNAGVTSLLPPDMGRLCKLLGVPVFTLTAHGCYLANPFWDEAHTRPARIEASLARVCAAEDLARISAAELQARIAEKLHYDEYAYQREQRFEIRTKRRAQGLHRALYQCAACGAEHRMASAGTELFCTACGARWTMDALGTLRGADGRGVHIPLWYAWQRAEVAWQIEAGAYRAVFPVRVEALPNAKGFLAPVQGMLTHTADGFVLALPQRTLRFPTARLPSVQTEYDYRGRGSCLVLSTQNCCFYCYCDAPDFNVTKLQFAAELFHTLCRPHRAANNISIQEEAVSHERF